MKCRTTEETFKRAHDSYKDRKFLYLFPRPDGKTYTVVNYDAVNSELNSFLMLFDVWGSGTGQHKVSDDENHQEVWFEVDEEFYQLAKHSRTFQRAIERCGVKIVFEYPFKQPEPKWFNDWKGMAAAARYLQDLQWGRDHRHDFDFDEEDDD